MNRIALLGMVPVSIASAQMTVYDAREPFQAGAGGATAVVWPTAGVSDPDTIVFDRFSVTRTSAAGNVFFSEWTSRLAGFEIAVSGVEDLRYDLNEPVVGFGVEFVEPELDANVNGTFIESTFRVTLFSGDTELGSFEVERPNDAASFIGVTCPTPFDRVEFTEIVGGAENEFFGRVYLQPEAYCPADLAPPFGVLDLDDVDAFVTAFLTGDAAADLSPPYGVIDLSCVNLFISTFLAGCG